MGNRLNIDRVSENSFLVQYHEHFSTELSEYIARCAQTVWQCFPSELLNTIPSYNGLLITFQPWVDGPDKEQVYNVISSVPRISNDSKREIVTIPTYYHREVAEYLDDILDEIDCTLSELITYHTAQPFFVYMIGFCPGFGYMGELPPKMHLPRRQVPQLKIPAGSVAIAEFQTAVYPIEMPGGWHIIGRTPRAIFDSNRKKPSLFQQGDLVQFHSISREEYLKAGGLL